MEFKASLAAKIFLFAAVTFAVFLLPNVFAQPSYSGKIESVAISPQQIFVNQQAQISVGVQNNGGQSNDYILDITISQSGVVVNSKQVSFSIDSGGTFSTTSTFTPTNIGTYTVSIRLLDKFSNTIYDSQIDTFNSVSNIGPFDVTIQPLAKTVEPGQLVPFVLDLKNMGTQSLDAQINVDENCILNSDITSQFVVYIANSSEEVRTISLPACQEQGLHEISASVIVLNKSWITSTNQFFINQSTPNMVLSFPKTIIVKANGAQQFSVQIINPNNFAFTNLQVSLLNIPTGWYNVDPSNVQYVGPNGNALFVITISPPADAQAKTYPIEIAVGSGEALAQDTSNLQVLPAATTSPVAISTSAFTSLQNILSQYWYVIVIIAGILMTFVILKSRKQQGYSYNSHLSDIRRSLR